MNPACWWKRVISVVMPRHPRTLCMQTPHPSPNSPGGARNRQRLGCCIPHRLVLCRTLCMQTPHPCLLNSPDGARNRQGQGCCTRSTQPCTLVHLPSWSWAWRQGQYLWEVQEIRIKSYWIPLIANPALSPVYSQISWSHTVFFFGDRVSLLCSLGCPGTCYVD